MRCSPTRSIAIGALFSLVSFAGCAFDTTGAADPADNADPADPLDPDVDLDAAPRFPPGFEDAQADAGEVPVEPTAFRLREVKLRDPHLFARAFRSCNDITDSGPSSVNAQIAESVGSDGDLDGFLDRGMVLVFRPFAPDSELTVVEVVNARCTAPADATTCSPFAESVATVARGLDATACDVPPAENLSDYSPPVEVPGAPCFATDAIDFVVNFGRALPSTDVVVSATYSPDGEQLTGLIRGFISEGDADAVALTEFLPGGYRSCARHDARDVGPGGESGWYWYFNFVAERTTLTESTL